MRSTLQLLRLAARNLARNRRRTLLTLAAVGFGAAAILFLEGFVSAFLRSMIETSASARIGAIQVHRKGYLGADEPLKRSLAHDPALVARIRAVPGVTAVAPRLAFDGMISNGAESTMFLAVAIDPALEYAVCPRRATYVAPGSEPLRPDHPGRILIGRTLADSLGATRGSTLVMQAAAPEGGSSNALDVEVAGFLPSARIIDSKRVATVSLKLAQELLRMEGRVTEYVVGVADLEQAEAVAGRLRASLGSDAGGDLEVTTWSDVDTATRDQRKNMRFIFSVVAVVLLLLVATGIVNTMMMSVHERTREIGTMLAVGVRRWQILGLFLWEAAFLGLLGAAAGLVLGQVFVGALGVHGLTFRIPGGDPMILRPAVGLGFSLGVAGFALAGSVLAALYPAWTGARLRPVEALRAL